ncbi:MAG: hypothetical protein IJR89_09105 [Clostridia bacterium]|nr:hypothetical protein [Clostridia bacterium]
MEEKKTAPIRESLTVLLRRRSVIALCCVILTLILAFYGIIEGVNRTNTVLHKNGFTSFIYYTMISNAFAALSAAFVFPFAIEGIREKRFIMPKWTALLHYMATVSIAVTMVFVLAFISWAAPDDAFGGVNLITHVICPPLILLSFFQLESGRLFTWKDRLLGTAPCFCYLIVYYVEVVLIGEANGGWPDIYRVRENISPVLAIPVFLLIAFGVSTAVALLSNCLTKKRNKKMFRLWKKDLDPIEVKIEAFGMGRMAAQYADENDVRIPYDILSALAGMYRIDTEDLMRSFAKGLMMERKDREKTAILTNRDLRRSNR